jgi:hypothetical protein
MKGWPVPSSFQDFYPRVLLWRGNALQRRPAPLGAGSSAAAPGAGLS